MKQDAQTKDSRKTWAFLSAVGVLGLAAAFGVALFSPFHKPEVERLNEAELAFAPPSALVADQEAPQFSLNPAEEPIVAPEAVLEEGLAVEELAPAPASRQAAAGGFDLQLTGEPVAPASRVEPAAAAPSAVAASSAAVQPPTAESAASAPAKALEPLPAKVKAPAPQPRLAPARSAAQTAAASASSVVKAAAPRAKPQQNQQFRYRTVNATAFWVQAASFASASRAQEAKENLARLGFDSSIETGRAASGALSYRVRLGAWENRAEADKFKSLLREKTVFKEAFVTQSQLIKRVSY